MLSKLLISTHSFVLIIDDIDQEKIASKFLTQLLHEKGISKETIKTLPLRSLRHIRNIDAFLRECRLSADVKWNVLLPPLSDLLCYQRPAVIFHMLHRLQKCAQVQRTFLWASTCQISNAAYFMAAIEYYADMVLHLESKQQLSLVSRRPGGSVTKNRYNYQVTNKHFMVKLIDDEAEKKTQMTVNSNQTVGSNVYEHGSTFKIELEEDEVMARNALKLPYEKNNTSSSGQVEYTPDANDDFDTEDPDEDLCI